MPLLFEYLLKFSISLGAVYLFYILVLQRLTFYNWNRRYLLFYSLLCFFIPFTDITSLLGKSEMDNNTLVNFIPAFNFSADTAYATQAVQGNSPVMMYWQQGLIVFLAGSFLLLLRLALQYFSFLKMKNAAELLSDEEVKLYRVKEKIIPFSFNNSIFINHEIENAEELKEIIRHEFVHVKQKHTIDILFAELLCVVNWYNPFVWLMRKAIRQNLEFIADNNVLQSGFDRKQYQYLLLKVIGVSQFSITQQFNFSSLKKRIAMMNKLKSAKVHLLKFLFALPLTAILLLAFRDKIIDDKKTGDTENNIVIAGLVLDAGTMMPLAFARIDCSEKKVMTTTDENGYYKMEIPFGDKALQFTLLVSKEGYKTLSQRENWGNFSEPEIFDRYGKTIEFLGLAKKGSNENSYASIIGNTSDISGLDYDNMQENLEQFKKNRSWRNNPENIDNIPVAGDPLMINDRSNLIATVDTPPPAILPQAPVELNHKGYLIDIIDRKGNCTVVVKDKNKKEVKRLLLTEWKKNEKYYENLYGQIPPPPPPPIPATSPDISDMPEPPVPPAIAAAPLLPNNVNEINIQTKQDNQAKNNTNIATVTLKNGNKEVYNLNNPKEKAAFENKYGQLPPPPPPPAKPRERRAASANVKAKDYVVLEVPAKPLYIVDDKQMPASEDLNTINPSDIARVDVLKDKAATEKYGTKGKNGVVKITTKKNISSDVSAEIVEVRKVPAARVQMTEVPVDVVEVQEIPVAKVQVTEVPAIKINGKVDRTVAVYRELPVDADYYIDDVPATRKQVQQLAPGNILSIDVIKNKETEKKAGEKGKKGVIRITTKKRIAV